MNHLQPPPLEDGEIYIGCIGDAAGNLNHVILLPGDNDPAPWNEQIEWAQSIGGDLPTIIEMAMLYTHFITEFREKAYWTRDTVRCPGEYAPLRARYHSFADGHQNNFPLETSFRACAVRRMPAQTLETTKAELVRLSKIIETLRNRPTRRPDRDRSMTMREAFEAWASNNGYMSYLKRKKDGSYFYGMTAHAWDIWQARQREIDALKAEIERLKEWTEDDQPLPEDDEIKAARPRTTDGNDLHAEAMRLVGAKRSKYALIDLVNWLLVKVNTETQQKGKRDPDGFAYRYESPYRDGTTFIEFNSGEEVNGSRPIEVIPYWLGSPPVSDDARDAARYRWLRDPCSGAEHVIYYSRGDYGKGLLSDVAMDDAIDAAMQRPPARR